MTDLQIGLVVAGVLVIIGIYLLTKIQERKIQKKEEALYRLNQHDALMDAPNVTLDELSLTQAQFSDSLGEDNVPVFSDSQFTKTASKTENAVQTKGRGDNDQAPQLAMPDALNPQFDYICGLVANEPIDGGRIQQMMQTLSLSKPVQWVGVQAGSLEWQPIAANGQYQYVCIGLQLADRKGALSQDELDDFLTFVQGFADQADAVVDIPDTCHVIERAQSLDAFCAEVDVQIGIHIVANSPQHFAGTKIRSLAEASGCVLNDDGCFDRMDMATATKLFVLYNLGDQLFMLPDMKNLQTPALGLMMDLPLAADGVLVFNQMLLFAKQLSQTLNGRLVDVNEQPLTDKMIDKIRKQIVIYQGNMRKRGISPGSSLTARLFH